jgi:hypothetical protein
LKRDKEPSILIFHRKFWLFCFLYPVTFRKFLTALIKSPCLQLADTEFLSCFANLQEQYFYPITCIHFIKTCLQNICIVLSKKIMWKVCNASFLDLCFRNSLYYVRLTLRTLNLKGRPTALSVSQVIQTHLQPPVLYLWTGKPGRNGSGFQTTY